MCKKVRTLLRVSSRQQLHENDIPVQRAEAKEYIKGQPDWIFDGEYIEKAVSAYKNSVEDREVLVQILEDAKKHRFQVLLAYMSDRIGRKEEYSTYISALNRLGVEVWTIKDGQLKTEEHIDRLLNYIRFWQNEGESRKTGMRVRDSMQEMVKAGRFMGGKAPYGYRLVPSGLVSNHGRLLKKLEVVEEQAAVVRKIYSLAVYQGFGYEKIAKALNMEGIPAITADKWKSATIASILKNPVYMGYMAYNRRVNHGSFTRLDRKDWVYSEEQIPELVIVQKQEWETAQQIREARKRRLEEAKAANLLKVNFTEAEADCKKELKGQKTEGTGVPFCTGGRLALTGLAWCGYCGKRLKNASCVNHWRVKSTGETKAAFLGRYICPERCRERSCYSKDYLEGAVFGAVSECLRQIKGIDVSKELCRRQAREKENAKKELRKIQREQRELRLDIETLEEKIPQAIRGEYFFSAEKLSGLIREKTDALKEITRKEKEVVERLKAADMPDSGMGHTLDQHPDWGAEFLKADTATRHMILSSLIDKIIVKDGDIVIKLKISPDGLLSETVGFAVPEQRI